MRMHCGPAKQEAFSRSTSFEHSARQESQNPTPPRSTKMRFGAPMMRNRFPRLFRRAFMIGLSNPKLRNRLASLSRLSYIVVAFAVAFVGLTLAGVGFGFVFNFTHSAPFGIYKEISDPAKAPHTPALYVFFCPAVRWARMKGAPNYRKPMRTCPDGFAPLIKPVVAWPGDTVETSAQGVNVNGQLLANTLTIDHNATGHPIRPYAFGSYHVHPEHLWV